MESARLRTGFFIGILALSASMSYGYADAAYGAAEEEKVQETVNNGLPNPSAQFRPNSNTVDIFADLLVWKAEESGSENWAEVITSSGSRETAVLRDVRFRWNAGFRVGLGYEMSHDQWDTQFYYTWFHTTGKDHVSSSPGTVYSSFIGNFYVDNPDGHGISGIAYQHASMRWTIRFNIFDWELGRAFWISKALSLRPFVGLKGGWIHQSMHTHWKNPNLSLPQYAGAEPFSTATENLKNNFWGLGPSGGCNTKWNVYAGQQHSFSLLGDLSGAIMYGHWTFADRYKNDIGQVVSIKLSHINSGAMMLRTFLGFGWDANFREDRYHFSAKLGYEMQFWLDQLQFYTFDTGRLNNELTLQGGTLELCFDF